MLKQSFSLDSAKKALEIVEKANNILLHFHPSPDGDCMGSSLAMYFALTEMGKQVSVIQGDSNIPNFLKHLPGVNIVKAQNYFETDLSAFDLFIILDSGATSLISRVGDVIFPPGLNTLVIDHHSSNVGYGEFNLVDSSYPSTAELLYSVFKVWNVKLTHDIAANLFTGMYTDTGGFKFERTSERTFLAAAELVTHVPEFSTMIETMNNSNTLGLVTYVGLALSSIKIWNNGKIIMSIVTRDQIKTHNISDEEIKSYLLNSILGTIEGVIVSATVVEHGEDKISVSLRSRNAVKKVDVAKIAEIFGGGGHTGAAGIRGTGSGFELAEKIVIEANKQIVSLGI